MSSSLEVQNNKADYGPRYGEEAVGLVESGQAAITTAPANQQTNKASYQDDEGILPVILEDYLDRVGVMDKLRPYISGTGQIRNETARQLLAEFWGTLLFEMFGGSAPSQNNVAPAANGFALVALIYAFANVSGGHLNPAVSFALMCTGHMKWWKAVMYMACQILGAIFGALIYAALIPGLHIGQGAGSQGCFGPDHGATNGSVFGWEMMSTFLLVLTVYAAAVAKPGHGNTAPLAIGLSLYAAAISAGPYTGASLNPARTIGPAAVFQCNGGIAVLYVFAEFFGAACAAGLAIFLYGRNPTVRVRGQGL